MQQDNNPLVSIIVITYNSSKFVLETLESAKAQTYQNIELIVSDDCSNDNTVDICKKWLDENAVRFVRTELVTTEKNTGIAPNCNRGLRCAKGEWVRLIAGDDLFVDSAISSYLAVAKNPLVNVVFSKSMEIDENGVFIKEKNPKLTIFNLNVRKQYKKMLTGNLIPAPTGFFRKINLEQCGLFNENYPFFEDYPMYLKLLKNGNQFFFTNEITLQYRRHAGNVSSTDLQSEKIYNPRFVEDCFRFYCQVQSRELLVNFMPISYLTNYRVLQTMRLIIKRGNNKLAINWKVKLLSNLTIHAVLYKLKK